MRLARFAFFSEITIGIRAHDIKFRFVENDKLGVSISLFSLLFEFASAVVSRCTLVSCR